MFSMRQYFQKAVEYFRQIPTEQKILVGGLSALTIFAFATAPQKPDEGKLLDEILASDGSRYELRLHKDNFHYGGKLCYLLDVKNEKLHGMNHISTDLVALSGGTLKDGTGTVKFCGGDVVVLRDGKIVEIQQRDKSISKDGKIVIHEPI